MMDLNEYQNLALRTASNSTQENLILNGVMGICGEGGECIDLVKKSMFQGHELNKDKLKDELGDVMWYLAVAAKGIGVDLAEVAEFNINKLKTRFPNKFTAEDSIARVDYNKKN